MNVCTRRMRAAVFNVQQIDVHTDHPRHPRARQAHAAPARQLQDWFVCDIDAHHVETVSWKEIVTYIEDPGRPRQRDAIPGRARRRAALRAERRPRAALPGSVGGRIPHQDGQREIVDETDVHRDVTLTRRAMDSLGIDNMVVFPTPMLFLGMHPQPEMEVWLGSAYNRWLIDRMLSGRRPDQVADLPAVQHARGGRAHGRANSATRRA